MPNMYHSFDSRLEHRAMGSAALTATAVLGTITQRAAERTTYRTLVNVEAIDIASNNELYQVVAELSNDSGFSTITVAGMVDFGATEVRQSGGADTVATDCAELMWSTEQNDTVFQYARVRLIVSGTSPSITLGCYSTILGDV